MAKNSLINKTRLSEIGHLIVGPINAGSLAKVQTLAFISPTYSSVKYVSEGNNVTFECAAIGVPFPLLNWSFIGNTKISLMRLT